MTGKRRIKKEDYCLKMIMNYTELLAAKQPILRKPRNISTTLSTPRIIKTRISKRTTKGNAKSLKGNQRSKILTDLMIVVGNHPEKIAQWVLDSREVSMEF